MVNRFVASSPAEVRRRSPERRARCRRRRRRRRCSALAEAVQPPLLGLPSRKRCRRRRRRRCRALASQELEGQPVARLDLHGVALRAGWGRGCRRGAASTSQAAPLVSRCAPACKEGRRKRAALQPATQSRAEPGSQAARHRQQPLASHPQPGPQPTFQSSTVCASSSPLTTLSPLAVCSRVVGSGGGASPAYRPTSSSLGSCSRPPSSPSPPPPLLPLLPLLSGRPLGTTPRLRVPPLLPPRPLLLLLPAPAGPAAAPSGQAGRQR